jgi:hypothetical protein
MRRLLRPAIVIPAVAVLLFGAGIVYAVTTGLDSGAVDENEQVLAEVGVYPSSKEVGRNSETFAGAEAALPVPKGVVTTAAYAPPEGTDQLEIVNCFLSGSARTGPPGRRLAGAAGTTTERSYRVTFSTADRCLILGTAAWSPVWRSPCTRSPPTRGRPLPTLKHARGMPDEERVARFSPTLSPWRFPLGAARLADASPSRRPLHARGWRSTRSSRSKRTAYRFGSNADALATALVCNRARHSEREARQIAGLPV